MFEKMPEHVFVNPNTELVNKLTLVMKKNGGYCPCRLKHVPNNLCPCKEFRDQIQNADFNGFCHCHLYYKEKTK